jgi:hypothetical protein
VVPVEEADSTVFSQYGSEVANLSESFIDIGRIKKLTGLGDIGSVQAADLAQK